jgi:site-specific DNA recombinase
MAQLVDIAEFDLSIRTPVRGRTGGKPLSYSALCVMFRNPFYKKTLMFNGTEYKGNQPRMVSDEEFERVQQIIDPTHTTRPKDKTYNFELRNLFKCGECGFAITAEQKFKTIKSTGERKAYIYYHCTGKSKQVKCSQKHLHVTEDELMRQIKEKLSKFTIRPEFYKLAIEALAEQEDEVVAKDQTKTLARDKAIEKKKQAIANLRRMRYGGEADDDAWYYAEVKTLEDELATLQNVRNKAEHKARDWRAVADETFTFARYAKEDFDGDDLEKKRAVVVKLGEKLEILDRAIQFKPNKYFIPLEKMNEKEKQSLETVRTGSQQRETGSLDRNNLAWLRGLDSNQRPSG